MKNYYAVYCTLVLIVMWQPLFSQQNQEEDFYLLKSDWTTAKDINEAKYFMQAVKENDTTYTCRYYNKIGSMVRQEVYLDSDFVIPNGRFCWYNKRGNLDSTGMVYKGKKNGVWNYYSESLKLTTTIVYNNGNRIEKRNYLSNDYTDESGKKSKLDANEKAEHDAFIEDSLQGKVQFRKASFGIQDTDNEWKDFLKKNITVPQRFLEAFGSGIYPATSSFIVNKEGNTEDIYLLHSCEWSFDAEVLSAIKKSPAWEPAIENGEKVNYRKQQTVTILSSYNPNDSVLSRIDVVCIDPCNQVEAKFPGGAAAAAKFFEHNLNANVAVDRGAPVGEYTVVVSFLVLEDGTIAEVEAIKDPGYGTAEELMRVIKKFPKFTPAMQDGKPVKYRQRQSTTFSVYQN